MSQLNDPFNTVESFGSGGKSGKLYSLPALEKQGFDKISRLPVSIRIVLESVLRNCDGVKVTEEDVKTLASWNAAKPAPVEIPFTVSRIVLQDFTGVPLLVDLAAMRAAVKELGKDPALIEPLVPVDLVVDHSVQVDRSGTANSFLQNLEIEFERNTERYEFLKWGQQAFETFQVVPPAIGIVHQVNLEHLAKVVFEREVDGVSVFYPDSLVGTDSHTTMINGIGVVGWGVGGIEAEAGMLGQPVSFLTPEVIGVHLSGELVDGVTATDLTLRITELLRKEKVVGKFVEFFGEGASRLTVADRATIANMAPEYGATIGFFPVDEKSLDYMRMTGRSEDQIALVKEYYQKQGLFGIPKKGEVDYTKVVELDLSTVVPSVAGPKRPQDRIDLPNLKNEFLSLLSKPVSDGGYGKSDAEINRKVKVKALAAAGFEDEVTGGIAELGDDLDAESRNEKEMVTNRPANAPDEGAPHKNIPETELTHGSVLIAAITSCTNTSNPSVMVAAGLLAKKAIAKGLKVNPTVKTSLGPGSRVVTEYLNETGLQSSLDQLGFNLVGYGCTTCIGNSGPLEPEIEEAVKEGDLVTASVLSGNRNFEARIHSAIKSNFLMSPPLVVAFALAGRVDIDMEKDPIGTGNDGQPVYLRDIWPSREEVQSTMLAGIKPEMFTKRYSDLMEASPQWAQVQAPSGDLFAWDDDSTYIQLPPYFDGFGMEPNKIVEFHDMRPLAILGDSVTTDHISPAGAIIKNGPAGRYLMEHGVEPKDFNSFGSRRGNDRVMTRGTFANVRIKNLMVSPKEGGYTKRMPEGEELAIYDACQKYAEEKTPLIVIAGDDYGMGSSRDWAAKGTALLGVKAVIARSFERIHRSNLIGMGVLPLVFKNGETADSLNLDGSETFSLIGLSEGVKPLQDVTLKIVRKDGSTQETTVTLRLDTAVEIEYYRHGGILPYVLRNIVAAAK